MYARLRMHCIHSYYIVIYMWCSSLDMVSSMCPQLFGKASHAFSSVFSLSDASEIIALAPCAQSQNNSLLSSHVCNFPKLIICMVSA